MSKKEEVSKEAVTPRKLTDVYTPLGKQVVIEHYVESKTKKGIIIPEQYRKKNLICEVIAVGEQVTNVKTGDYVIVGPSCRPMEIPFVADNHMQIFDYDIIGKVTKEFRDETYSTQSTTEELN